MTEILLEKEVRPRRITTIGHAAAQALNDPVRIKILEILNHKPMSAEGLNKALSSLGFKKATTTIRHHLDTLKKAGLIDATKMVEVRGAVMKYYAPTLRAFSFDAPRDFDTQYAKLIQDASSRVLKILKNIHQDRKFAGGLDQKNNVSCPLCKTNHFKEYMALEILNCAAAQAIRRKEYIEMLGVSKPS